MADGNLGLVQEEIKKIRQQNLPEPEDIVIYKPNGEVYKKLPKRMVVTTIVICVLLVLLVVFLSTTLSGNGFKKGNDVFTSFEESKQKLLDTDQAENNDQIYLYSGYKMDDQQADYGVMGQRYNLQVKTLIRGGTQAGDGRAVQFGQNFDGKMREMCAYMPDKIYTSQGEVDAKEDPSSWNPQMQSSLFLPGNTDILVPFQANPSSVLEISRNPDFDSLLQVNGKLYMAVHHESPRPSEVSFMEVNLTETGDFEVLSTSRVDFSAYNGTWTPCSGSLAPWGTHLSSQEYDPDARLLTECDNIECMDGLKEFDSQNIKNFMRYYGYYYNDVTCYSDQQTLTFEAIQQNFNPYMYGHIPEISVDNDGNPQVKLWFTLGRFSHEAAKVMPDNKTVYMTDDGTNVGFYRFVADVAGDFSSGCIAAVTAIQRGAQNEFDLEWITLGCGSNDEIENAVRSGIKFSDMFDTADPDKAGNCPQGYNSMNVGHDHRLECLQLLPGQTKMAAFLESRRMSALMGGTTEFSKWEGITYDAKRNRLYHGMSEVRYGMENNMKKGEFNTKYDIGGPNHIKVPYNPCGCVYMSELDSQYKAINLQPLICGNADNADDENDCDVNSIAGPDNVVMMGQDAILIGEDSDGHVNNVLWMYDLNTAVLTRVASCMYGAEVTGPWYHENVQGSSYIFYVCQHPYDESNREKVTEPEATGQAGWVNYLGPLPVLQQDDYIICDNIAPAAGTDRHNTQATPACYVGNYTETMQ